MKVFFMNEVFRGAFDLGKGAPGSKNHPGDESELGFEPNLYFWLVLRHPDQTKNQNIF